MLKKASLYAHFIKETLKMMTDFVSLRFYRSENKTRLARDN